MSKQGVVAAVFAGLTVSKFSGRYEASSSSATRVYLDLEYPDVTEYQTSYKWEKPQLKLKQPMTVQMTPLHINDELTTIQEILQKPTESFEGGKAVNCIAEVTSIIHSMNWYYKACKRCKTGYSVITDAPRCQCTFPVQSPEYKLALTIKDNSGTMDCIAFYTVAEELVECSALQASQNMQVEPDNHPPALRKAIGKKRLFHIGMSRSTSSNNPIRYVLKRCSAAETQSTDALDESAKEVAVLQDKQVDQASGTPPSAEPIQASTAESRQSANSTLMRLTHLRTKGNNRNRSKW